MIDKRSLICWLAFLTVHSNYLLTPAQSFYLGFTYKNSPMTSFASSMILHESRRRTDRPPVPSFFPLRQSQMEDEETPSSDSNSDSDDFDECNDGTEEQPTWIQKAMGVTPENPTASKLTVEPPTATTVRGGIAGFAVDSELGFVCVLHHQTDDDDNDSDTDTDNDNDSGRRQRFVYAVVSPSDRSTVQSAEALCLVQLAGGLDLGAAVFPPDTLARLIVAEIGDDDEEEEEGEGGGTTAVGDRVSVEDLRSRTRLLAVTVLEGDADDVDGGGGDSPTPSPPPSTAERDSTITQASEKVTAAVRNLPGLNGVTPDDVLTAMRLHAGSDGSIDRSAFSELLDTLRRGTGVGCGDGGGNLRFRLTASVAEGGGSNAPSTLVDFSASAFEGIGLALRYEVMITVSDGCVGEGGMVLEGMGEVAERFPAFRPVYELEEDAKIMDGFIPSMFFKGTAPENDDKA